ncbi:MAG: ribbon-helix-helix protein, CopG family [Rhodobacterales bacterium]|nr:ribbon-helix-helix protein, CopG family [Rhodobacterales bacterium]
MDNASAKRLSIIISDDLDRLIDDLASEAGTSRTDIVRRALAVMKAFKQQKEKGRGHIGFVEDARKLDVEIVNVL